MFKITKSTSQDISAETLNRLYNEAYPYISDERKRLGEERLRDALFNDLDKYPIMKYEVDDYIVGIVSYTECYYNGKRYMFHRHPIYGCDINGSKAWWYSEEFQRENSLYWDNNNFAGLITIINPNAPAAKAVLAHVGGFDKHCSAPLVIDNPSELGISLSDPTHMLLAIDVIKP